MTPEREASLPRRARGGARCRLRRARARRLEPRCREPPRCACMEDDPQFNAGRGAVLNHDGDAELDAAIMDGHGPRAGAVAGVRHVKNPVELARLVMEKSPHVLLVGERRRGVRARAGRRAGAAQLLPHRAPASRELARRQQAAEARGASRQPQSHRHRGRGGARSRRQPRRGHLHRGPDQQAPRPRRRLAAHRRRHLRQQRSRARSPAPATASTSSRQVVAYDICALVQYRTMTARAGGDTR